MSYAVLSIRSQRARLCGHATHFVVLPVLAEHCSCSTQQIDKVWTTIRERVALRPWVVMKQRQFLRFVRSDLSFSVGIFRTAVRAKENSLRSSVLGASMIFPLESPFALWHAGVSISSGLDNRLRAPVWQLGPDRLLHRKFFFYSGKQ